MKLLLIQSLSRNFRPIFPAGLARIVSVIEHKHDVKIFDPNIEPAIKKSLTDILKRYRPDVVGISLRSVDSIDYIGRQYFYPDFVALLRLIKGIRPTTKIVVGGGGFSLFAREIVEENPEIDFGVFLEGEATFPELLDNLDDYERIKGLYFRNGKDVQFSGPRESIDFGALPMPSYGHFELDRYLSPVAGIGIETKRGCCLTCAYCPYPFLTGRRVRKRDPSSIVDEMEYLISNYGIRNFTFIDPVFNIPLEHGMEVCEEIVARGLDIHWTAWNNEKTFTEQYARLAIKAGCKHFPFSTDAFSDKSLRLLGKNYTQQEVIETLEVAEKVSDINIGYGFFLNPPGASWKSFIEMVKFLMEAKRRLGKKMKGGRLFLFGRIRIEPHTKIHEIAIKEGLITPSTNLLRPVYYSQPSTKYLETIYGIVTWPLGVLVRFQRIRHYLRRKFARSKRSKAQS